MLIDLSKVILFICYTCVYNFWALYHFQIWVNWGQTKWLTHDTVFNFTMAPKVTPFWWNWVRKLLINVHLFFFPFLAPIKVVDNYLDSTSSNTCPLHVGSLKYSYYQFTTTDTHTVHLAVIFKLQTNLLPTDITTS